MGIINFFRKLWTTPPRHSVNHRRYDGAKRGRLYGNWLASSASANSEIWASLSVLRNRSRDLIRNNDYARGIIQKLADNVIYQGIGFQAQVKQVKDPTKNDDRVNTAIESAWKEWAEEPLYCHTAGKLDFKEIQQLVFRSWLENGEVFVRKVHQSFSGSPIPLALEIIDPDRCPETYNGTNGKNKIVMGVELDRWIRPVAYHFYKDSPGELFNLKGREIERIPASEIIHLHSTDSINQIRGVPLLASTILRLKNVGDYEENEQLAAKLTACVMGAVMTADADILGENNDSESEELPADEQFQPGIIRYYAQGEKFDLVNPTRPNPNLTAFIEAQLRASGAGTGMSYEHSANDYSKSNYSSTRVSLLNSRDRFKVWQVNFASKFNRSVYMGWLDIAVVSGVLNFADYELRPKRYQCVKWLFRGWSWVDPYKEVQATLAALAGGLTTLTKVAAEQGEDFEEMVKTIAREREMLKAYGLNLSFGNSEKEDVESRE
jgi:lambda family phage portal protein